MGWHTILSMHKKSIFLVGPMGSGKSTVGRLLAEKLSYDFVDSDHVIENKTGVDIPMIFDIEGEEGFRRREKAVIDEFSQLPETVLATGGGAILDEDNRKNLRSRGLTVYLKSSVDTLVQRTKHDKNRPLLQNNNRKEVLTEILKQRESLYLDVANLVIETAHSSIYKVVKKIIDKLDHPDQLRENNEKINS